MHMRVFLSGVRSSAAICDPFVRIVGFGAGKQRFGGRGTSALCFYQIPSPTFPSFRHPFVPEPLVPRLSCCLLFQLVPSRLFAIAALSRAQAFRFARREHTRARKFGRAPPAPNRIHESIQIVSKAFEIVLRPHFVSIANGRLDSL